MASKITKYDLENVTDYIGFESFCHDLMSREGYKDIEPLGGSNDKGRDAIHVCKYSGKITIFAYSVREDWKEKLKEDLDKIKKYGHQCNNVVFITTSNLSSSDKDDQKKKIVEDYGWQLEIYDLERIGTLIDNHYSDLKQLHSNIFSLASKIKETEPLNEAFNSKLYAEYMLSRYDEWLEKYTPLLAEHKEIETFVISPGGKNKDNKGIPVVKIPEGTKIAILLGESGAGKTTALWKIAVERCKVLAAGDNGRVPILISLRGWSNNFRCRDLVQQEFSFIGASEASVEKELKEGNCLVLIDGLNELPPHDIYRAEAYKDIQRFLINYAENHFMICCRSSDYSFRLLDLEQLKPKISEPKLFQIKRLDRNQVIDYIRRYHKDEPDAAEMLLQNLNVYKESEWRNSTSILHLARIPLYLQLIILEFKRSNQLPNSRAELLRILIHTIFQREGLRYAAKVDRYAKERLLASVAYQAISDGYSVRFLDSRAQSILQDASQRLKQQGMIQADLTFGAIWEEILSNNFLRVVDWMWIEWLHQLILDYFLACEIVHIRTEREPSKIKELNQRIERQSWEQACVVAIGLLDKSDGAMFLEDLIKIDAKIAQVAFESLPEEKGLDIANSMILDILKKDDPENERFLKLARTLPYLSIVQNFSLHFKSDGEPERIRIAEAVSSMVIKYYPLIAGNRLTDPSIYYDELMEFQILDDTRIRIAVKRGIELLNAWIGNKIDLVRFYAAKGLWETNRGRAAQTMKDLLLKGNKNLAEQVRELMGQWGIT